MNSLASFSFRFFQSLICIYETSAKHFFFFLNCVFMKHVNMLKKKKTSKVGLYFCFKYNYSWVEECAADAKVSTEPIRFNG